PVWDRPVNARCGSTGGYTEKRRNGDAPALLPMWGQPIPGQGPVRGLFVLSSMWSNGRRADERNFTGSGRQDRRPGPGDPTSPEESLRATVGVGTDSRIRSAQVWSASFAASFSTEIV